MVADLETLRQELDDYLRKILVIGFNSSKYDINVIKKHLYRLLLAADELYHIIDIYTTKTRIRRCICLKKFTLETHFCRAT
jgi:hypothetical protein